MIGQLILCIGRTKFDRLFLIGTKSAVLSTEALKAAVAEAKAGIDVSRYERAIQALREYTNDPDVVLDAAWVEETKKRVQRDTERLEVELRGYKNNLIKESIRVSCAASHLQVSSTNFLP